MCPVQGIVGTVSGVGIDGLRIFETCFRGIQWPIGLNALAFCDAFFSGAKYCQKITVVELDRFLHVRSSREWLMGNSLNLPGLPKVRLLQRMVPTAVPNPMR